MNDLGTTGHAQLPDPRFATLFRQEAFGVALRQIAPTESPLWMDVNDRLCRMLGYSRQELLRLSSVQITPPEERRTAIDYNHRLASGEIESYSREKRYMRRDGTPIWVRIWLSSVREYDGRPRYVISVIEDIDQQKRDALALSEGYARQAASLREMEAFAARVSHDMLSPLASTQMELDRLRASLGGDGTMAAHVQVLDRVRGRLKSMRDMVDAMLRLSREGSQPLVRQPVDMYALFHSVAEELGVAEGTCTLTIEPLPTAYGDVGLLRQACVNLISNAVKFSALTTHPTIRVHGHVRDEEAVYFVRDNGIGLPEENRAQLFTPFARLHTGQNFAGTGIGLATVRRIAEAHGGRAWVEKTCGPGAEFAFSLPTRT